MVQRIMNTHDHTTLGCLLTALTLHLDQFDLIDENFEFLKFPYTNERKNKAERKRSRSRSQEKVKSKKKKNKDRDSKSVSESKSESRKKKAKKEDKNEFEEKKISLISAVLRKMHKMPLTNLNSVYQFSMGVFSLLADVFSLVALTKSLSNRSFAKVPTQFMVEYKETGAAPKHQGPTETPRGDAQQAQQPAEPQQYPQSLREAAPSSQPANCQDPLRQNQFDRNPGVHRGMGSIKQDQWGFRCLQHCA